MKVKQNSANQHKDLFDEVLGNKNTCTEGEKEENISSEDIVSLASDVHVKEPSVVNIHRGQHDPKEPEGVLGPRILGPEESVTKVYVRRKEVLASRGKAQYPKSPTVNSDTGLKSDCTSSGLAEEVERQYALVKDLGLTHGGDASKVQELMKDMDTRDNKMAVEMGIKNQQL